MSGLTPAVPLSPSSTKAPPAPFLREGLALYAWVLCCPSRWHAHVAAIDPVLPPDFSLAHLSRARLRRPALRRLLLQVAIMGAAIALVATVAAVVIAGIDARYRGMAVLFGLGLGLTGTVITASGLSVIGAAWGGPFICVVFALACGMALDAVGGAGPLAARFDALDPVARVAGGLPAVVSPAWRRTVAPSCSCCSSPPPRMA
jgi:hypothetical protein